MKTVYISGAVTTDPNYREKFNKAEKFLVSKGFTVINPVKNEVEGKEWSFYLKKDIRKLLDCDTIYILSDWHKSKGAKLEIEIALAFDYEVILEGEIL